MQTNIPNVFAAGDVVTFPVELLDGARSSIHHQQVAEAHGEGTATFQLSWRWEWDRSEQFLRICKKNIPCAGSSQVTVLL